MKTPPASKRIDKVLIVSRRAGTHTGADRLSDSKPYPMATNVPAGKHETRTIASAVSAMMLPRKRYRVSGFDSIKDGAMSRPKRPAMGNDRAYTLEVMRPRLPLILGHVYQPNYGKGNV